MKFFSWVPRIRLEVSRQVFKSRPYALHEFTMIEGLGNLFQLSKPRFLVFGFPVKMGGIKSFPISAVALEIIEWEQVPCLKPWYWCKVLIMTNGLVITI